MLSGEKKFSRLVCPVEEIETLHVQNSEHQMHSLPCDIEVPRGYMCLSLCALKVPHTNTPASMNDQKHVTILTNFISS